MPAQPAAVAGSQAGAADLRFAALDHRQAAQAEPLHALRLLAYAQEAALLGAQQLPALQQSVAELQAKDECFVGAWRDGALVGAVATAPDLEEPGQQLVTSLVVHPAHQRLGIARRLMLQHVLAGADGELEGSGPVVWAVVTGALNAPALALYQSLGFVPYRRGVVGPEELPVLKLRRVPR